MSPISDFSVSGIIEIDSSRAILGLKKFQKELKSAYTQIKMVDKAVRDLDKSKIDIRVDAKAAQAKIKQLQMDTAELRKKKVEIAVEVASARAALQLKQIQEQAERLDRQKIELEVEGDFIGPLTEMEALEAELRAMGSRDINIDVELSGNKKVLAEAVALNEELDLLLGKQEIKVDIDSSPFVAMKLGLMLIPNLIRNIFSPLKMLGQMLVNRSADMGKFGGSITKLLGVFLKTAPAIIALVFSLEMLGKGLQLLSAAISMTGGILTAWIGVLGKATSGILLPIGPILVGIGAAAGLAVLGFKNMGEEAKKLLKPFVKLKDKISEIAEQNIARPWIASLLKMVKPLRELTIGPIRKFSEAVGGIAEYFTKVVKGPQFAGFMKAFQRQMPRAINSLGHGFARLTAGMFGFFKPIMPFARKLSKSFDEMMTKFAKWTNSAKGKNAIHDFMKSAWRAARNLWKTLGNLTGALGNIFGIGDDAGQDMLKSLRIITKEFEKWTKGEGREKIKKWFEDARKAATDLWNGIKRLGKEFGKLDTEKTREDLREFSDNIGSIVTGINKIATAVGTVWGWLTKLGNILSKIANFTMPNFFKGNKVGEAFTNIKEGWKGFDSWFKSLGPKITGALSSVWKAITAPFRKAYNTIIGNSIVPDLVNGVVRWFKKLPSLLVGALNQMKTNVINKFNEMKTNVINKLNEMKARAIAIPGQIKSAVVSKFGEMKSAVTNKVNELKNSVSAKFGEMRSSVATKVNAVKAAVSAKFSEMKTVVVARVSRLVTETIAKFASMKTKVVAVFAGAASWLLSAGKNIMSGLLGGIKAGFGPVVSKLKSITAMIPKVKGPESVDKKLLQPTGKWIMEGLVRGFDDGREGIKNSLESITALVERTMDARFKSSTKAAAASKEVLKGLKDEVSALMQNAKQRENIANRLEKAQERLNNIVNLSKQYAANIKQSVLDFGSIGSVGMTEDEEGNTTVSADKILSDMRDRVATAIEFKNMMNKLIEMDLNKTTLDQLTGMGVEAGLATAKAIVDGGGKTVTEINTLTGKLKTVGKHLGNSVAEEMYGAGIQSARGIIRGLRSQERELIQTARALGQAMTRAFRQALKIHSPSKVFTVLGEMTVKGLTDGLSDISGLQKAMGLLSDTVMKPVSPTGNISEWGIKPSPLPADSTYASTKGTPGTAGEGTSSPAQVQVRVFIGDRELTDMVRVEVGDTLKPLRKMTRQGSL